MEAPSCGESKGGGPSNAAGGARDDRDLSGQRHAGRCTTQFQGLITRISGLASCVRVRRSRFKVIGHVRAVAPDWINDRCSKWPLRTTTAVSRGSTPGPARRDRRPKIRANWPKQRHTAVCPRRRTGGKDIASFQASSVMCHDHRRNSSVANVYRLKFFSLRPRGRAGGRRRRPRRARRGRGRSRPDGRRRVHVGRTKRCASDGRSRRARSRCRPVDGADDPDRPLLTPLIERPALDGHAARLQRWLTPRCCWWPSSPPRRA